MFLIIDKDGSLITVPEITNTVKEAFLNGIISIVRVHDGRFEEYCGDKFESVPDDVEGLWDEFI